MYALRLVGSWKIATNVLAGSNNLNTQETMNIAILLFSFAADIIFSIKGGVYMPVIEVLITKFVLLKNCMFFFLPLVG